MDQGDKLPTHSAIISLFFLTLCPPIPLPQLTGAVGGHVVVGVLAVVLDGCTVRGEVVPGEEGDKAVLQLWRRLAVSN